MVADVLVADFIENFILFYMIRRSPVQHISPFVGVYMEPGPSDQCLLNGGRFSLISSARRMGTL